MNNSTSSQVLLPGCSHMHTKGFEAMRVIGGLIGFVACLLNGIILRYIRQLIGQRTSGYIIQLAAVSVNAILNGITLILASAISVLDSETIALCAIVVNFGTTFMTISRINIMVICIQTFSYIRQLRTSRTPWRKRHTLTLISVNVSFAIIVLVITQTTLMHLQESPTLSLCNPLTVFNPAVMNSIPTIMFLIEVIVILLSNVFCIATLIKLRSGGSGNAVHPSSSDAQNSSNQSQAATDAVTSGRVLAQTIQRTRRGAMTFLLIVAAFNVSLLVGLVGMGLQTLHVQLTPVHFQVMYIASFVHVLLNPIVILSRTKNINQYAKRDVLLVKQTLLGPCVQNRSNMQ